MSLTLKNRIFETTTTTGTGVYLLAGVVNASHRPFADVGDGGVTPYMVEQGTKSEWGLGTYNSGGNTLARTTILGNHLGTTAAINWSAGTKNIYSPDLAELFNWLTFSNTFTINTITVEESAGPSTPDSGFGAIYAKSDGLLYWKNDAGTEFDLTGGGGTPTDITVADTADATCFVALFESASGDLEPKTDVALTYDATSGLLTATGFVGPLTGNADTATALATARSIYGNSFDGTAILDQIIASTYGGTGNGFTAFTGPTTSEKTFTLPDASATILTTNDVVTVAQGGTGLTSLGTALQVLRTNAAETAIEWATAAIGDALVANPLSQFAATTSSELSSVISDETGTGSLVFADAPEMSDVVLDGSNQVTGRIYTDNDTLTDGATITIDFSLGNKFTVTLEGNRTIEFSNTVAGQVVAIRLLQDGTGSRTISWPAGIKWAGGSEPTLTTTADKADWIGLEVVTAGSAYDGFVLSQNH